MTDLGRFASPYLVVFSGEIYAVKEGIYESETQQAQSQGKHMREEVDLTYLGDDVTPFVGSCAISGLSKTTQMKRKVYTFDVRR